MFDFIAREDQSGPYPIHRFGEDRAAEIAGFLASLDAATLEARFHRHTTTDLVAMHVAGLDWTRTSVLAWIADGAIRGLVETTDYTRPDGTREAEAALCVHADWRGRGIGRHLLAAAAAAARARGVRRCVIVLGPRDGGQARLVRGLGGSVDWQASLALLVP